LSSSSLDCALATPAIIAATSAAHAPILLDFDT
jgi:hypothetical protein